MKTWRFRKAAAFLAALPLHVFTAAFVAPRMRCRKLILGHALNVKQKGEARPRAYQRVEKSRLGYGLKAWAKAK
jgi:hypothetical protein